MVDKIFHNKIIYNLILNNKKIKVIILKSKLNKNKLIIKFHL